MRCARRMDEHVAARDGMSDLAGTNRAGAGQHHEQFPLGQVGMERAHGRSGWNPTDLHVKRMPPPPSTAVPNTAERERYVARKRMKFSGRRMLLLPSQIRNVDALHVDCRSGERQ